MSIVRVEVRMRYVVLAAAVCCSPVALADSGGFTFLPPLVVKQPKTVGTIDATAAHISQHAHPGA